MNLWKYFILSFDQFQNINSNVWYSILVDRRSSSELKLFWFDLAFFIACEFLEFRRFLYHFTIWNNFPPLWSNVHKTISTSSIITKNNISQGNIREYWMEHNLPLCGTTPSFWFCASWKFLIFIIISSLSRGCLAAGTL